MYFLLCLYHNSYYVSSTSSTFLFFIVCLLNPFSGITQPFITSVLSPLIYHSLFPYPLFTVMRFLIHYLLFFDPLLPCVMSPLTYYSYFLYPLFSSVPSPLLVSLPIKRRNSIANHALTRSIWSNDGSNNKAHCGNALHFASVV